MGLVLPIKTSTSAPREGGDRLEAAAARHPHLARHLQTRASIPMFVEKLDRSAKNMPVIDVIYPVGDPVFIHVYDTPNKFRQYVAIEPRLDADDLRIYHAIRERILEVAPLEDVPEDPDDLRALLLRLVDAAVTVGPEEGKGNALAHLIARAGRRIRVSADALERIRYFLVRNIVDSGPIEPIIRDPYLEDVHAIGLTGITVVHKIFDVVETNVKFQDARELDLFLRTMSERIGRPVSDSRPIVDATLPDGSRINIVYSTDVSQRGSSFTIRKLADIPPSITQVISWGAMSPTVAAYLWLCLENGMSVFVCGETASGKTTSLNAMLPFIRPGAKVFTAEDTPEVRPPHRTWQQLVTREGGPEEGRVLMFDLLKAALRSRPNYIIVGEIRGAEGAVAFQAMQTGHPCIATFHASSVAKMIQRFSAPPINIPLSFMDNLNVCLIQMAVSNKGKTLRRVLAVDEIEGYSDHAKGVLTRGVFKWDPATDVHTFRGRNNSFVLENKIAVNLGYQDKRRIYDDLDLRARILGTMVRRKVFDYSDVLAVVNAFQLGGVAALPFEVDPA